MGSFKGSYRHKVTNCHSGQRDVKFEAVLGGRGGYLGDGAGHRVVVVVDELARAVVADEVALAHLLVIHERVCGEAVVDLCP